MRSINIKDSETLISKKYRKPQTIKKIKGRCNKSYHWLAVSGLWGYGWFLFYFFYVFLNVSCLMLETLKVFISATNTELIKKKVKCELFSP